MKMPLIIPELFSFLFTTDYSQSFSSIVDACLYIQPTLNPINIDVILYYRFWGRLVPSIQFYAPHVAKALCFTNSTFYFSYTTFLNYRILSISSLSGSNTQLAIHLYM